jgi:hypothetical protein
MALVSGCVTARPPPAAPGPPSAEPAPARHDSAPLLGGTLAISADGRLAVASDPDRDRISIVDLARVEVVRSVELGADAEPGRIALAGDRAYVVLRRRGAIASIDLGGSFAMATHPVCPAPRGIAHDAATLLVACAGGELIRLDLDGRELARAELAPDLRDVVMDGERALVSRFRSAEVILVDRELGVMRKIALPALDVLPAMPEFAPMFEASVAWRMVPKPSGGAYLVHQRAAAFSVDEPPLPEPPPRPAGRIGYGALFAPQPEPVCPTSLVHSAITPIDAEHGAALAPGFARGVLPIDVAIAPSGETALVVFAGNHTRSVVRVPLELLRPSESALGVRSMRDTCIHDRDLGEVGLLSQMSFRDPVAVAWASERRIVVQYADPPALVVMSVPVASYEKFVVLGDRIGDEAARRNFHRGTVRGLACASCHPEGGDDGHVWNFGSAGVRRTQALGGGVLASAPFHWNGEHPTLASLVDDVLVERMGGVPLGPGEVDALGAWLDTVPAGPAPDVADAAAVARGEALFRDRFECARCHLGGGGTDDRSHDVGTGGLFQTPALRGLVYRAPYFHDGCADDLESRFEQCHTPEHGDLDEMTGRDRDDLVAYLSSL